MLSNITNDDADVGAGATATSKAIVYDRYGPPEVLELRDVDTPAPSDGQVLVRVRAASISPFDWHLMRGRPYVIRLEGGITGPKRGRLGSDVAGTVEAVGSDVTRFRPGDEVFGSSVGTLAEYAVVSEAGLAPKPANLGWEEAAAVPTSGFTAIQGLRDKGGIEPGQTVLINGASGGVGTFAVQVAKSYAAEVTGVCSSPNVDLVRSLGADEVIDYTREDFARSGQRYDLILDAVGNRTLSDLRSALTGEGTLVLIGPGRGDWVGPLTPMLTASVISRVVDQTMLWFLAQRSQDDLLTLKELIESGTVTPVIDRAYPLDRVGEAIAYLEEGHARGKVVITI